MANEQNLRPGEYKLTLEEQKKGGIASGIARKEKATMKKTLEMLLEEKSKNPKTLGKTYRELATLGLLKGAINGNSQNYRTILEVLGELTQLEIDKQQQELSKVEELLMKIEKESKK